MRMRNLLGVCLGSAVLAACGGAARDAAPSRSPEHHGGLPSVNAMGSASFAAPSPGYPAAPAKPLAEPDSDGIAEAASISIAVGSQGSGAVKAGTWDDNANYLEFQRYLAMGMHHGFHRVDITGRRFIVVRDARGKSVPRCPVTVADSHQRTVLLTTTASGRAILFPQAEGLRGEELSATAKCQGQNVRVNIPSRTDGVADIRLAVARTLPKARTVDVAFVLDTTGSMGEEIAAVKSTIEKVAAALETSDQASVKIRVGMVEFKDRGDEYVTHVHPMTRDLRRFSSEVSGIRASGGGDYAEAVNAGVHAALGELDWGGDAIAKVAFLIGDAPPHLDYANDPDYAIDMKDAAHRGIQLFTIAASGMDDLGQVVWRQMAQYTGATNLFVLRGGAGPQSRGAGDPSSSCGGTQSDYASGNLDSLILSKIRGEMSALERDPLRIPGLGQDENAKACADRVLMID